MADSLAMMPIQNTFRLLRPEEVIARWQQIAPLLDLALEKGAGEAGLDDLLRLVLGGRMFVFALFDGEEIVFSATVEFMTYPRRTVMLVGFGAGRQAVSNGDLIRDVLSGYARRAGASSIQAFCREKSAARLLERHFGAERLYTVMECRI